MSNNEINYIKSELKKSRYNYDLFTPGPNNASIEIFNKSDKEFLRSIH